MVSGPVLLRNGSLSRKRYMRLPNNLQIKVSRQMTMTKTIALLITLDTKFQEADYLIERIEKRGHKALLMDIGVVGEPGATASITQEEIAEAGGSSLQEL